MRVNYCLTGARNCTVTLRALLCRTTSFTHQAYLNTTWFLGYWTVPAYCDVPTDLLHCLLGPVDDRGGLVGMRILRPNGCVFWSLGYAGLHTWLTLKKPLLHKSPWCQHGPLPFQRNTCCQCWTAFFPSV